MGIVTSWPTLDVAIGLSFLFFLLSLTCSSINEAIAALLNLRAKTLERWLGAVLADPTQLQRVTSAIGDTLDAVGVPPEVRTSIGSSVAAALANTTTTVADIKAQLAAALHAANVEPSAVAALVDRIVTDATAARAEPPNQGQSPKDTRALERDAADVFFSHPAARSLTKPPRWGPQTPAGHGGRTGRRPSYLPASTFATVLLDQATGGHVGATSVSQVIANLPGAVGAAVSDIASTAVVAADEAAADLVALRRRLEHWYDESMQRVSGWYRRRVQVILAILGLLVAVGLNADAIGVANSLWTDATLRSAIVANAGRAVTRPTEVPSSVKIKDEIDRVHQLSLPLGWDRPGDGPWNIPHGARAWASKVAGLLITTFALMLGAPFWFDLLGRLFQIRATGAVPASTAGSSDPSSGRGG